MNIENNKVTPLASRLFALLLARGKSLSSQQKEALRGNNQPPNKPFNFSFSLSLAFCLSFSS